MHSRRFRLPTTLPGRMALGLVLIVALIMSALGYDRYAESQLPTAYPAPGLFVQVAQV